MIEKFKIWPHTSIQNAYKFFALNYHSIENLRFSKFFVLLIYNLVLDPRNVLKVREDSYM